MVMMHPIYMPFTETQLGSHFAESKEKHVNYYAKKIDNYQKYLHSNTHRKGNPFDEMKGPCSIEG